MIWRQMLKIGRTEFAATAGSVHEARAAKTYFRGMGSTVQDLGYRLHEEGFYLTGCVKHVLSQEWLIRLISSAPQFR